MSVHQVEEYYIHCKTTESLQEVDAVANDFGLTVTDAGGGFVHISGFNSPSEARAFESELREDGLIEGEEL